MAELAEVYIIDVPYHADKAYTYYLPMDLVGQCKPGCLAEVPFGKGNRRMMAVVTAVLDGTIKSIYKPVSSCAAEPVLSAEMLSLCHFLKEYTLCTFGEAVHAVVPGGALTRIVEYFTAVPCPEENLKELSFRSFQVYSYLLGKKKSTRQKVQNEFAFDCTATFLDLCARHLVEKTTVVLDPSKGQVRLVYTLTEQAQKRLLSGEKEQLVSTCRSDNQKKMFLALAESFCKNKDDFAMEEKELFEQIGVSVPTGRACAQRLIQYNLALVMEETEYRDPFRLTPEEAALPPPAPSPLNEEQNAALSTILSLYHSGEPKAVLLHGVTGSGKTNVMLSAIDKVLADGRGVILLVPEIALTPQTVQIYRRRFGDRIAVIHSSLSAGEKLDAWKRIKSGLADLVIGTRSAIFAPLPNIGMILIDEEHEYTYKSDTDPKYHAQDIARFRCGYHKAVMLLASATPSVTSYYKAQSGAYTLVELKHRYNQSALPQVDIVDMRGTPPTYAIGDVLANRLRADKAAGNQSILFLNRRGYNHFVSCRSCGKSIQCPHCSVSMTYHTVRHGKLVDEGEEYQTSRRENGILTCHMCGYRCPVPNVCPSCGQPHFLFQGCGTQKAEDDIESQFPDLRVIRMDTDTTRGKFSHETYLNRFRAGEADVLLGTQMVTKGHDFPKVATVGVLNADSSLFLDDYRASERTFSMLTQVIGRAGRGDVPGKAIIQTWNPDNEILHLAATQDYATFYSGEIRLRKALCFPPFCDIAVITVSGSDEGILSAVVTSLSERIRDYSAGEFEDVPMVLFGPFEAPVYRVQNIYRMRFVLKCKLNKRSRAFLDRLLCEYGSGTFPHAEKKKKGEKPVGPTEIRLHNRGDRRITVTVDLNPSTI